VGLLRWAGIVDRIEQARGFKRRRRVLVYCEKRTGLDIKLAGELQHGRGRGIAYSSLDRADVVWRDLRTLGESLERGDGA
jgi:hypothetical protein